LIEMRGGLESELELMYGDSDSLCYRIRLPTGMDLYRDVLAYDTQNFDFYNYSSDHSLYSITHAKIPGRFTDETAGRFICEYVALCPKVYSYRIHASENVVKKAKGICSKFLQFQDYKLVLFSKDNTNLFIQQFHLTSFNLSVHTIKQNRIALSSRYDKRFTRRDGVRTMAWGHNRLRKTKIIVDTQSR